MLPLSKNEIYNPLSDEEWIEFNSTIDDVHLTPSTKTLKRIYATIDRLIAEREMAYRLLHIKQRQLKDALAAYQKLKGDKR